jgi:hypothetical protein
MQSHLRVAFFMSIELAQALEELIDPSGLIGYYRD